MEFTKEQQAAIDKMIDDAVGGLKTKNAELLADLKKARKDSAITPEQLAAVEDERDAMKADIAKLTKEHKAALKTAEDATKALQAESGYTSSLLIDQGLTAALAANGVTNPALLKGAVAMLKAQGATVVTEGDKRTAKLGDKLLDVAVKEFTASDEGKHFVSAKQNSGGGAGGGGGGTVQGDPSKMTAAQKMEAGRAANTSAAK